MSKIKLFSFKKKYSEQELAELNKKYKNYHAYDNDPVAELKAWAKSKDNLGEINREVSSKPDTNPQCTQLDKMMQDNHSSFEKENIYPISGQTIRRNVNYKWPFKYPVATN